MDDLMRSAGADHSTAPAPPDYGGAVKKTCVKALAMWTYLFLSFTREFIYFP